MKNHSRATDAEKTTAGTVVRYTQERRSGETVGRPHQVKALEKKKKY